MSKKDKNDFNIPTGNTNQQTYSSVHSYANHVTNNNNASSAYGSGNQNAAPSFNNSANSVFNNVPDPSATRQMPQSNSQDGFTYNNYQEEVPQSIFSQPQHANQNAGYNQDSQYQNASHSGHQNVRYKPKQRKSPVKSFLSFVLIILIFVGLAWCLRTYVFCAYEIPSGSMEETIMTGDMVFAEKVSKIFSSPKRGDIVTFDDPNTVGRVLIKRVIATGGQTVDIKNNKVYVDNVELDEPYTNNRPSKKLSGSISYPYTVPQGYVWVMGDNRTNSSDSRVYGAIPESTILGHALAVYWPTSNAKMLN